jgi:hypothetical protein
MITVRRSGHQCGRIFFITCLLLPLALMCVAGGAVYAGPGGAISVHRPFLSPGDCPRVADPKLDGGGVPVSFTLLQDDKDLEYGVVVYVVADNQVVRLLANSRMPGSRKPVSIWWDGRDGAGRFVPPGDYIIKVIVNRRGTVRQLKYPVNIVRLGISEIEALPDSMGEEWQMVYFRKGGQYAFYATPAIHEYLNTARSGEVSDLDLDSGEPRPAVAVHTATASPVLNGSNYETECYNYPLCYLMNSRPRFEVTMGDSCTMANGTAGWCGYPVNGVQIRGVAEDQAGFWESVDGGIVPGQSFVVNGPELPSRACSTDRTVTWRWQYRELGDGTWSDIPGSFQTEHRFYTIVDEPYWPSGASGTQYAGPWVEVADYLCTFADVLKINPLDQALTLKAFIRGYFGQEGPLDTAIEGVVYDCYSMGGDGGATHYYSFYDEYIQLSRLLNNHANGIFLNCSDVSASSSTMLGMLGVQNVRMVYLGNMSLRAIWGIGCPDYTLNLWGSGHGFSYHHIVTRDDGIHVSDACMWLDEDGDPDSLPGTPGYNTDRPWSGADGYNELSATNNVSLSLDSLPDIH